MSTEPPSTPPTVLVLASGRGERFAASGGTVHKLQAKLAGRTVLERTLAAVRASGLPWHLEDAGHPGMGDSIAAAVAAAPHACGWLILPADLPLVRPETLRAVAAALREHEVVVPMVQGQRGHPVGFSATCRADLLKLQGDRGAAGVIRSHDAIELIVNDIGCVTDIDTQDDLARAEALLAGRG
ncbi:MAG: nucleotidyltransferase family protein [Proteobacteria bacterium]|nr:nucleotidyltransferase family protein [Pseudomonadota bacterium]